VLDTPSAANKIIFKEIVMRKKIVNKKALIGALIVFIVVLVNNAIVMLSSRGIIKIISTPNNTLLMGIVISLLVVSLGYDGGKLKKWLICTYILVGLFYLIVEIGGMFVQYNQTFMFATVNVEYWVMILIFVLPAVLTGIARLKAKKSEEISGNKE